MTKYKTKQKVFEKNNNKAIFINLNDNRQVIIIGIFVGTKYFEPIKIYLGRTLRV